MCKQLCKDHGATVYLGSRSAEKGATAVQQVKDYAGDSAQVELVQIDVGSDDSVTKAAAALKEKGVTLRRLLVVVSVF